jgi:cyclase
LEDFAAAIEAGADALLAASVFHFGIHRITDVKKYLSEHGYPVRMSSSV